MSDPRQFSLRDLIREVCASSDADDPDLLAKEVERRIRKEDRDAALREALPSMVRWFISNDRRSTAVHDISRRAEEAGGVRPVRSWKVDGSREYWRVALEQRYAVVDGHKHLRDCTRADLEYAIRARREMAQRTLAKAAQLSTLLDLLVAHGVGTVGELPESVLGAALVKAA